MLQAHQTLKLIEKKKNIALKKPLLIDKQGAISTAFSNQSIDQIQANNSINQFAVNQSINQTESIDQRNRMKKKNPVND